MLIFYLSLIEESKEQDDFERLYKQYRQLMFYAAKNILNDDHLAEDAVQAAFLKISRNFQKINDISCHKTKAFVVIVVENVAKTMYIRRKKYYALSFDEIAYEYVADSSDLEQLIEKLSIEELVEKLKELPPQDSEILTLRYFEEFSNKEIAQMYGIKETLVRKRLERARKRFAQILNAEYEQY